MAFIRREQSVLASGQMDPLTPIDLEQNIIGDLDVSGDITATGLINGVDISTIVSAGGSIDTHSDVDTVSVTPGEGTALLWDGSNFVPAGLPFVISIGRDGITTNVWLRGADGIPLNQSPIRVPYDVKLVAISSTTQDVETWDVEIYKDSIVRTGGTPSDANKIAELVVSSSNSASATVDVDITAGSEIGVFCRGSVINRPQVSLYFVRRV